MDLAKARVDVGLNTNNLEPMLAFWQNEVGAKFDHVLPLGPGMQQHRHDINGSVLKINHYRDPLPDRSPSGYSEVLIARAGLAQPTTLRDPDGNLVTLTPPNDQAVAQIGIRLRVRDLEAHHRFYRDALRLPECPSGSSGGFRAGETTLLFSAGADAPSDAAFDGRGWRYITFQIFKVDSEHSQIMASGLGSEGFPPRTLGQTARISMVRDPDGNWIELSQRASITGTLEPD